MAARLDNFLLQQGGSPDVDRRPSRLPSLQTNVLAVALAAIAALALWIGATASVRLSLLFLVGTLMGLVLYHANFGFTSAFRVLLVDGRSAGLRAVLVMLGLACLLFFPALAAGSLFGEPVAGSVAPAGISVAVGSFLFGVGMQAGSGCASGTLYTAGGGSSRMLLTLAFFITGSVIGVAHQAWWQALPSLPAISLVRSIGWPGALAINLSLFALIWMIAAGVERARHGRLEPIGQAPSASLLRGPWPVLAAAVALALLNFATLYLAGRPWGIVSAFGLWGGKLLQGIGVPVAHWQAWSGFAGALGRSVLTDVTSVMDFGIMLGALAAASLAGHFHPTWHIRRKHLVASAVGGLLLGYGARLAYGCNIGAFFSGIASGSLHGWLWIVGALAGSWVGIKLRPAFDLPVERGPT